MFSRTSSGSGALLLAAALIAACPDDEEPDPTPTPAADDDDAVDDDDSAPVLDDDDAIDDDDSAPPGDDDDATDLSLGELCFPEIWDPKVVGPDYEQFAMTAASHCWGTDHQDIAGVERVVFLGDSVTVGVPNFGIDLEAWGWLPAGAGTAVAEFYRNVLVPELVARFGLEAPATDFWENWPGVDVINGTGAVMESGDFAICAKWGARNDDLIQDNTQIEDCIPPGERGKTTLVIMTSGGNDLASLTGDHIDGVDSATTWAKAELIAAQLRAAMEWFRVPDRFPSGVFVVYGNMYEFTDATADTSSCAAAELAGFGQPPPDPDLLADQVIWIQEEYMSIAVDNGMDMIWMLEHFCGHGFRNDDPRSRCFRGIDTPRWFDLSCTHPNAAGHAAIANMFLSVVDE